MNVTIENLAPCKKLVRVELDAQAVDAAFESMTKDFQKQANLPGFRPGKAPKEMVVRKYEKDIQDEVKRKLIGESYKKAIEEKKLDELGYPDIEEIQFGRGAQPCNLPPPSRPSRSFNCPITRGCPSNARPRA